MNKIIRLYKAARDPKSPKLLKVLCGVAVVYVLFPLDFLPDFVPFIGWLDDAIVFIGMMTWAYTMIPKKDLRPAPINYSKS